MTGLDRGGGYDTRNGRIVLRRVCPDRISWTRMAARQPLPTVHPDKAAVSRPPDLVNSPRQFGTVQRSTMA